MCFLFLFLQQYTNYNAICWVHGRLMPQRTERCIMYSGLCGEPDLLKDPLQSLFLGCCGTLHVYMIRSLADNSNNSCVYR